MKTFFTIFSHLLTKEQILDAKNSFGVEQFISLPQELQALWSAVPPEIENIGEYITPFKTWLSQNAVNGDVALISGDFGATCCLAFWCVQNNITPVYSTTKREVIENFEDGKSVKKSVFAHVRFRKILD